MNHKVKEAQIIVEKQKIKLNKTYRRIIEVAYNIKVNHSVSIDISNFNTDEPVIKMNWS
jgi:hypothetical protein